MCDELSVPAEWRGPLSEGLHASLFECNYIGGTPEWHDEIERLICETKREGFRVNLTSTGVRVMLDEKFAARLLDTPENTPHVFAVSFDHVPDNEDALTYLKRLLGMDLKELKGYRQKLQTEGASG